MKKLGILGSPQGPYVQRLVRAARERLPSAEIKLLTFADLQVGLQRDGKPWVTTREAQPTEADQSSDTSLVSLNEFDAVIVRTMPLGALEQVIFRMDALQVLESLGVLVINPPKSLEVAIDKWLTLHRLAAHSIPVPETIACQSRDDGLNAWEALGQDVVVKPLFGGEGRGIVRVTDRDMAWRVFSTLEQLRAVAYVQPFLPNFGYDIRVLMIGDQMLSVKRRAPSGQWRTNVSLGSVAEPHELTDAERDIAFRASQVIRGTCLGIDLLPTCDGRCVVLEVNAVPGWKGTEAALGVDIAGLIIEQIKRDHGARHHA